MIYAFVKYFKIKVWKLISIILTDKYKKNVLWQKRRLNSFESFFSFSKNVNVITLKRKSNLVLLSKVNFSNKLKFFIQESNFDSKLPKHFWFWNKNHFSPAKSNLSNDLITFFFRKKNNNHFNGFLDKSLKKAFFPTKNFVKWIWL